MVLNDSKVIDKFLKEEKEARDLRRKMANWEFINKQPTRIRLALEYFIETGDMYVASRVAGLTIEEFNDLRKKANIPIVS